MSERLQLAEYFILNHGQSAARALELLSADVAGDVIDAVSDNLSMAALKAMLPYNAARCLAALSAESAAKYLAGVPVGEAAAILRHTEDELQRNLIDLLPRQHAIRVSLILGYPQSLVGAWIDPFVLSLPLACSVADAKNRITNEGCEYQTVFVVDDGNKVRGSVSLVDLLLRSKDDASLSTIMRSGINDIRASSTVERAIEASGWSQNDLLPVTDRTGRFIGVIRYADLRRAFAKPAIAHRMAESEDNFMGITEAYYLGLADVLESALAHKHDHSGGLHQPRE